MNPVSTATTAVKSAFSFREILKWIALFMLFNLIVSLGAKFFPAVFSPIYRLITNPLSFLSKQGE